MLTLCASDVGQLYFRPKGMTVHVLTERTNAKKTYEWVTADDWNLSVSAEIITVTKKDHSL